MLIKHISHGLHAQAPLADPAGAGSGPGGILDPDALQRLRDLDPTGDGHLMEKIVCAFDALVTRLLPQLEAAGRACDAVGIHHVAHTLKSSAASLGAVKLAQMCAQIEAMATQGQTDGMQEKAATLCAEAKFVLDALKHTLVSRP